jgi:hypothetical protein
MEVPLVIKQFGASFFADEVSNLFVIHSHC